MEDVVYRFRYDSLAESQSFRLGGFPNFWGVGQTAQSPTPRSFQVEKDSYAPLFHL